MKKPPISTECVFNSKGSEPGALILAAFRLWLRERLDAPPGVDVSHKEAPR